LLVFWCFWVFVGFLFSKISRTRPRGDTGQGLKIDLVEKIWESSGQTQNIPQLSKKHTAGKVINISGKRNGGKKNLEKQACLPRSEGEPGDGVRQNEAGPRKL